MTDRRPQPRRSRGWIPPTSAVTIATVGFMLARTVGDDLAQRHPHWHVNAAPFVGTWMRVPSLEVVWLAVAAAVVCTLVVPLVARRSTWTVMVATTAVAATVFPLAVATIDDRPVFQPLESRYEYLPLARQIGDVGEFVSSYTDRLAEYPTHVKGHPPGPTVAMAVMSDVGLGGARWVGAALLASWGAAVAFVLVTVRRVGGDIAARRVAPVVVLTPAVVFVASSVDPAFAALGALAVWATVWASEPPAEDTAGTWRRHRRSVVAGCAWTVAMLWTYGAVALTPVAAAVAIQRRRLEVVVGAAATGVTLLVAVWAITGFWWLDGLSATRDLYVTGAARLRPWWYFVWANPVVLAFIVGPVTTLAVGAAAGRGLRRLRRRTAPVGDDEASPTVPAGVAALAIGTAIAVLVADLSGMSKGEVERVWLLFVPWVAVTAAWLPTPRAWLSHAIVAVQGGAAIALAVMLRTPW